MDGEEGDRLYSGVTLSDSDEDASLPSIQSYGSRGAIESVADGARRMRGEPPVQQEVDETVADGARRMRGGPPVQQEVNETAADGARRMRGEAPIQQEVIESVADAARRMRGEPSNPKPDDFGLSALEAGSVETFDREKWISNGAVPPLEAISVGLVAEENGIALL